MADGNRVVRILPVLRPYSSTPGVKGQSCNKKKGNPAIKEVKGARNYDATVPDQSTRKPRLAYSRTRLVGPNHDLVESKAMPGDQWNRNLRLSIGLFRNDCITLLLVFVVEDTQEKNTRYGTVRIYRH